MKAEDVKVGKFYVAKVSGKLSVIKIDSGFEEAFGGFNGTNMRTGRILDIMPKRLRYEVKKVRGQWKPVSQKQFVESEAPARKTAKPRKTKTARPKRSATVTDHLQRLIAAQAVVAANELGGNVVYEHALACLRACEKFCPLDLELMQHARPSDLLHDVNGIDRFISVDEKSFRDGFSPRFAAK